MEQPNRSFVILWDHYDGLQPLQRMYHIPGINLKKTAEIGDRHKLHKENDSLKDSIEVRTERSCCEYLNIKGVKAGMTPKTCFKLSMRKVTSVTDEFDKCEREDERRVSFANEFVEL